MLVANIVFVALLAGFVYLVNFKFRFHDPVPKATCNAFAAIVLIMWLLQLVGIGR